MYTAVLVGPPETGHPREQIPVVAYVDGVMRKAYKRIVPERLVQTRVPSDIARKIEAAAKQEGDTVAGWVRRVLFRQFGVVFVEAWTCKAGSVAPDDGVTSRCQPQFLLRPVRDISASDRVFAVHDHPGKPVPASSLADRGSTVAGSGRWIILRGSPIPWEAVTQYAVGSIVEVTLRPVHQG
jgi:proteasome lid subunit RPN8/RPN11